MPKLTVKQQKLLKAFHLISVAVWFTSVITMSAITTLADGLEDGGAFAMVHQIYHFVDFKLLTPAAVLTLLTGLVYSMFTRWGFFKHGWLIYKWIITVGIIVWGTVHLGPMCTEIMETTARLQLGALNDPNYLAHWRLGFWAGISNAVLLFGAVIVSTLKPWKNIRKNKTAARLGSPRNGFTPE